MKNFKNIVFILLPLLFSCKIGNFSDIENYGTRRNLFVFAGNDEGNLYIYAIDHESNSLSQTGSIFLSGPVSSIVADHENKRIFAASGEEIWGFDIHDYGGISTISGYPHVPDGANEINHLVFTENNSYLYAFMKSGADLYGYSHDRSAGTLSQLPGYPVPASTDGTEDFAFSTGGNNVMLHRQSLASWYNLLFAPDGSYVSSTLLGALSSPLTASTAYDSYLCIFRDPAITPPPWVEINIHHFGEDLGEINTLRYIVDPGPLGAVSSSSFNRSKGYLYYAHSDEPGIYTLKLYIDGEVSDSADPFPTSGVTGISRIEAEPYGEYLVLSSGSYPSRIHVMKINYEGFPDDGVASTLPASGSVTALKTMRLE